MKLKRLLLGWGIGILISVVACAAVFLVTRQPSRFCTAADPILQAMTHQIVEIASFFPERYRSGMKDTYSLEVENEGRYVVWADYQAATDRPILYLPLDEAYSSLRSGRSGYLYAPEPVTATFWLNTYSMTNVAENIYCYTAK